MIIKDKWEKIGEGEKLKLEKVSVNDTGSYECIAHDHVTRIIAPFQVSVEGLFL